MEEIVALLSGGTRRSIGRVPEVVALVEQQPAHFHALIDALEHADPVVRIRAADAVEKITLRHPSYLWPYRQRLITQIAPIKQQEVRWHVAQMAPRRELIPDDRAEIIEILFTYLQDTSAIVQTCALQALADLAIHDVALQPRLRTAIESAMTTGSAAVKSRGRKLLARFEPRE